MPMVGDIIRGTEIGKNWGHLFVWHSCITCGKERWVRLLRKKDPMNLRCYSCANKGKRMTNKAYWEKRGVI